MIERLIPPVNDEDLRSLAEILVDTVASGSAVSFLAPLTLDQAEEWWRSTLAGLSTRAVVLVARDAGRIVATVQLQPAWAPNQPHRAEIVKMMVDRRVRRTGLGARLMEAIEAEARQGGFTLLTLDTKRGDPADRWYRRLGWVPIGVIPGYALDPEGAPHDAVFFYKRLDPGGPAG